MYTNNGKCKTSENSSLKCLFEAKITFIMFSLLGRAPAKLAIESLVVVSEMEEGV